MLSHRVALLFAYKRVPYLKESISILIECGVSKIYIAIDGPKGEQDGLEQLELLDFLENLNPDNCQIILWRRKRNLGIAISIISGLDWFFSHEEAGIIVEDDLKFDHAFVDFIFEGLEHFKHDRDVWLISGSNFVNQGDRQVQYVNYPIIWGWGTWSSRWAEIRQFIPELNVCYKEFRFSNVHFFWLIGLLRVKALVIDTWDIPIAYLMKSRAKYCVLPPVNLVSNMGYDHFSTHTNKNEFPLNFPIQDFAVGPETFLTSTPGKSSTNNRLFETSVFHIKVRHYLLIFPIVLHLLRQCFTPHRKTLNNRYKLEIEFLP
jgi:hypothetical protein